MTGPPPDEMRTGLLPALVRRYLERSLSAGGRVPGLVRIGQEGEMRQRPGGRAMRFSAVEELAVGRIAFSWRARFPLAIRVFDGYSGGRGKLEARVLGVPVMRQSGSEVAAGEVLRYLAELPLVPWAMEHNAELEWRELDERSVEVAGRRRPAARSATPLECALRLRELIVCTPRLWAPSLHDGRPGIVWRPLNDEHRLGLATRQTLACCRVADSWTASA